MGVLANTHIRARIFGETLKIRNHLESFGADETILKWF